MKCFGSKNSSCHCKIVLLDDQELIQDVQESTLGQELLDNVFRHLNLLETAYFGLRFLRASSQPFWLDPKKKVVQQLKGWGAFTMYFCVKFYSADPCRLLEEITRYQFFLQIKQDILQGRLPVTWETAAELGARIIQSELGDFDPSRHGPDYVTDFGLCPNQTAQTEQRTAEIHQTLTGHTPAQAEYSFLEKVRWLEMYGVDLHLVLGEDHTEYFIGLTPSGIIVLRGNAKVSNYFWPRISKVYFKGRYFMLRVRDKNNEESTFGFETPSKHACKHLWKCSVEHHSFFRLVQVTQTSRGKPLSISSRFRYSGRTEKEVQREASLHRRPQPSFSRTSSRRSANSQTPNRHGTCSEEADKRSMCRSVISIPQPVQSYSAMQRASSVTFDVQSRADSPRSVRSAPFSANQLPGLFSNSRLIGRARRSASADSQSSVDARSLRRRHRRQSGNESDASSAPGSSRSHRKHRHRRDESCSESERSCTSRKHRSRKHRQRGESGSVDMVDSEPQWREIQRRQLEDGLPAAGGFSAGPPAAVVSPAAAAAVVCGVQRSAPPPHRSGYQNSGMETESELSFQTKRRVRKHRSRSRSPESERLRRLPAELRKHLQFELVEPGPETMLHEASIPYTRVETTGRMPRVKYATKRSRHEQCAADAVYGSHHAPTVTSSSFGPPHSALTPPTATSTPLMTNHYSVPPSRPRPVAALVSAPGSSAPSGSSATPSANTLSNFYVTPSTASVPAMSSFCAPPMASIGVPLRPPSRFVPHPLAGAAHQELASHEHSDSGLGNESPNEFIRIAGSASPPPLPPSMPPVAISSSSTLPRFRFAPTGVALGAATHQHHLAASSSSTAAQHKRLSITGSLPRPRGRSSADILQAYTSRGCPVIQPPVSFRNSPPVVSPSPSPSMPPPLPPLSSSRTDGFVGELRQLLAHQLDISDTAAESGPLVTGEVMSGVMRPLTRGHRSDSAGSLELILSPLVNSAQTSRR